MQVEKTHTQLQRLGAAKNKNKLKKKKKKTGVPQFDSILTLSLETATDPMG